MDAGGAEFPVENAVAYATSPTHPNIGDFILKGDIGETDTGAITVSIFNGALRISSNDEDGKGAALTTELIFRPDKNGPLVLEARVQLQSLLVRSIFVGFCGTIVDDIAEPLTSTTITHTLTAADLCGFVFDSQLTALTEWHACYNGGTTTGQTISTSTGTGIVAVAGEWDLLQLEIFPNGTAKYYINNALESTVEGAVDPTVLQGAVCGAWGTTTTDSDIDVDYLLAEGNRDWSR